MKVCNLSGYALSICGALASLAGCGGSQPPIGATDAIPPAHRARPPWRRRGRLLVRRAQRDRIPNVDGLGSGKDDGQVIFSWK